MMLQVLLAQLLCGVVLGSELTFELPDNAKQCYYEDIIIGTKCTLEFQVRIPFFMKKQSRPRVIVINGLHRFTRLLPISVYRLQRKVGMGMMSNNQE